jgi:diguanylate cyclase (GGDEF)-like protein/PAS domain S-box-containing protein
MSERELPDGNRRADEPEPLRHVDVAALKNAVLESAFDCVIAIDQAGLILEFNPAAERTFGYLRADVIGQELAQLIVPSDLREGHRRALARWARTGSSSAKVGRLLGKRLELRGMRSDGSEFPIELAISRLNLDGPPLFTASLRDITERKRAEEKLRAAEARYRTLVEQLPLITYIDSPDGTGPPVYVSPQAEAILGHNPDEWLSRAGIFERCLHPDDRERVLAERRRAYKNDESHHTEYRMIAADGREVWILDESVPAQEPDGRRYRQGFAIDITARKLSEQARLQAEDQLRHQAFHDSLTDLPNRALFIDRLQHAVLRRGGEGLCAVLFLGLDDFKTINDALGHPTGDAALRTVGERLRSALRVGDTVARLGGDEFAVLVEDTCTPSDAARAAERLVQALATPILVGHQELFISGSIGIAIGTDPAELVRQADVAMYRAKKHGKAQYAFYESALDEARIDRSRLVADLRRATKKQEFVLHYQPLVDLSTGRIVGVEALVRWSHPTRGLLPPVGFIPLAEETGLIVPVGRWVLTEACRQAMRWQAELDLAQDLTISVNVSPRQLQHPGTVADVAAALAESGLDPCLLMLEITENVLIQTGDDAIQRLRELKQLGVRLALDDFGTGYSSLSALESLPVETLKIDRSFVNAIDRGPRQRSLARAIIQIGLTLGLTVVCEGIETAAQAQELKTLGCPVGQGFYFAKPVESSAIKETLSRTARHGHEAAALLAG